MQEHARLAAEPQREVGSVPAPEGPACVLLTRQQLLRRLARLGVVLFPGDAEPLRVRSPSGVTAVLRPGRWSAAEVDLLLTELGLSASDFQDTR